MTFDVVWTFIGCTEKIVQGRLGDMHPIQRLALVASTDGMAKFRAHCLLLVLDEYDRRAEGQ
jgi:hypothetical protein